VTGPSLTSETCMTAPKMPVGTDCPLRERGSEGREFRCRDLRGAAADQEGDCLLRRGVERELAHGEDVATDLDDRPVHHRGIVVEDAKRDDLSRKPVTVLVPVVRRHSCEHDEAGADRGTDPPVDATEASRTRCTRALTS
jgi:hypothetical protein